MKLRLASDEKGYALPSVLFLVVILSVIAGSIILQQYLSMQLVGRDVAAVKAEFAAESGIAHVLSRCVSTHDLGTMLAGFEDSYEFGDGGKALVSTQPWGMFVLVQARGISGKTSVVRWALAADRPTGYFENALVFANPRHQLILAGTSHIRGNVIVGFPGVSTGRLKGLPSSSTLPLEGTVTKQAGFQFLASEAPQIHLLRQRHNQLTSVVQGGQAPPGNSVFLSGSTTLEAVSDSVDYAFVRGNAVVTGSMRRYHRPLYLYVDGNVDIRPGAELNGMVGIYGSGRISIGQEVKTDYALFVSSSSIEITADARISAQCVAPVVRVGERVEGAYPTIILSLQIHPGSDQSLSIAERSRIEGVVAMIAGNQTVAPATIAPSAKIIGCVYANAPLTLDGYVVGTVVASDFEFYDPPTRYVGWLRTARINRYSLPVSFLLPPGFSNTVELDILDWL